jgi:hypothetical protein
MRSLVAMAGLTIASVLAAAEQPPPLDEMLKKIAESQESAQEARQKIVYTQFVHAKLLRTNGIVAREEKRTYTVTPKASGFERKLEKFEGWYERKGQVIPYGEPGFNYKGLDIDGDLMDDLINDWTGNEESRDGVDKGLFPLTAEHQKGYDFRSTAPYRVAFEPRRKDPESSPWKGEISVDPETLHPRTMNSTFAYKIPMAVKIIFGISLRQVGYSVTYDRAIDDLWFPVSAGTEFGVRVLFGYARTMTLSMKNYDFRRASAESTVTFASVKEEENK